MNLKSLFPHGSTQFFDLNPSLSPAQPQCDQKKSLGKTAKREEEGVERVILRYTGYYVRPLDPDNFAASTKDLTDGLRRCGLIHGDEPWRIQLITEQERVPTFAQERIEITITWFPLTLSSNP